MSLPSLARIPAPPDPILGLAEAFRTDRATARSTSRSGVFVDETGTTPVLPTVIEAERRLADAAGHEALPPDRRRARLPGARAALVLGADHEAVDVRACAGDPDAGRHGRAAGRGRPPAPDRRRPDAVDERADLAQPPAAVPRGRLPDPHVSRTPTRPGAGSTRRRCSRRSAGASPGDVVLLHGACHNPTGVDPSPELWRRIGDLVEERRVLPLVDLAYQGFGDGLREDAAGLLELVRPGVELLVSTSFSKTFSLYAERVGAMLVIAALGRRRRRRPEPRQVGDPDELLEPARPRRRHRADDPRRRGPAAALGAGARRDARPDQGQPAGARRGARGPVHPRRLGRHRDPARACSRCSACRRHQVARLRDEHGVYVVGHGRINVAGFTSRNLDAFADALAAVIASS